MLFNQTDFNGLYTIDLNFIGDERGWFMRTYSEDIFRDNIISYDINWVQMNHSFSEEKGTWRGFHFQLPPFSETKLIRCIGGSVIDYALDLRKGSKTFLKIFSTELSCSNKRMIYIPKGFAHGFFTLEKNCELIYMHDEYYNPKFEMGISYLDPLINFEINPVVVSTRDKNHQLLTKNFKGI